MCGRRQGRAPSGRGVRGGRLALQVCGDVHDPTRTHTCTRGRRRWATKQPVRAATSDSSSGCSGRLPGIDARTQAPSVVMPSSVPGALVRRELGDRPASVGAAAPVPLVSGRRSAVVPRVNAADPIAPHVPQRTGAVRQDIQEWTTCGPLWTSTPSRGVCTSRWSTDPARRCPGRPRRPVPAPHRPGTVTGLARPHRDDPRQLLNSLALSPAGLYAKILSNRSFISAWAGRVYAAREDAGAWPPAAVAVPLGLRTRSTVGVVSS